jgi:AraC-like DNA-binding protein
MNLATRTDTQSPALHVGDSRDLIRVHGVRANNLKDPAVSIPKRRPTVTPVVTRRLLRAKDLMDSEYARELKVERIAQSAHLTAAHFSREFCRAFGETPHHYLLSRRLERAAALLANTDYTVTRICELVGLSSLGSFSTAFRRVYAVSPTTYRAQYLPLLAQRVIPPCVLLAVARSQLSRIREDASYPA